MSQRLKTVIMMGSAREGRMGDRVLQWVTAALEARGHVVRVVDPRETPFPLLNKPHHWYKDGEEVPADLDACAKSVDESDCLVLITAEYNHCAAPGLLNSMDHFGFDAYAGKPSAIVTYSMSDFGGVRAGVQLRSLTGELGCIAIPKMLAIGAVHKTFQEDGTPVDAAAWETRISGFLQQLEWFAAAFKAQKAKAGPP